MLDTKIICVFPVCGKTYYIENREEENVVLDLKIDSFRYMQRKRTLEELEEIRRQWDSVPHLLDGRAYIRRIKDEMISDFNPDFPDNYINVIKENIGKFNYIFVEAKKEIFKLLENANIDFTIVFPEQSLLAEYVGRSYMKGNGNVLCDVMIKKWDDWILDIESEIVTNNRKHYRLKHNEYLSNALK